MRVEQFVETPPGVQQPGIDLVLAFGDPDTYGAQYPALRACFPNALIAGCSGAGEIAAERVDDFPLVLTAIDFAKSRLAFSHVALADHLGDSRAAGRALGAALPKDGLRHILLLAEGLHVNGSALIQGISESLPDSVQVTGGLAGDGPRFHATHVYCNEQISTEGLLAIGLYGDALRVGYGSQGGWDCFGPERLITSSEGNVLFTLDDKPALELYKSYLGEHASELPAAGLKFPLALRGPDGKPGVVRTILAVDEADGSMTFAGDMPQGSYARLMRANFERLVDGAASAAHHAVDTLKGGDAELAILISCVGRRMVLGQAVEEEVEAVRESLGDKPVFCGFYSYGEISPMHDGGACSLHNQTMTITTLREQ